MARHVARAGAWSAALSTAVSSACAFPHISATSRLYQLRVCVQVRTFLLFFRDLQAFFFSLFALVRSTFACGTPWQSTWPGQTFRIASAARELHHSHPAFQWGPGRLFHRDGARVLIDSALWKTEPCRAACFIDQLAPTVARQNQRHSSKCDETKQN